MPGPALQDAFLQSLIENQTSVGIYLVNGIKLQGYVSAFDDKVVLLRNTLTQMVYKHAISTVVPAKDVDLAELTQAAHKD